ncbi:MAG: hypothetical protein NT140_05145 [Deltaproteobacteria bacterium]|nr:hypothetical protein [Deltaproteobacteria bacterium]
MQSSAKNTVKKITESMVSIKTVDGSLLRGKINLGDENRVSDIFTKSLNTFIVLSDVFSQSGESKVMIVNKNHIVWIEPEENAAA